tara:strand:- start:77039 stop:77407 length:369 start_codon:yes stop_codon:yes gene_type:complete
MKTLDFCFRPDSLEAAIKLLKLKEAKPILGKSDEEISSLIKHASVENFNKNYKDKVVDPVMITNGVVHGIVWGGLLCLFSSPSLCSIKKEPFEVSISEESSQNVRIIAVQFLTHLDRDSFND